MTQFTSLTYVNRDGVALVTLNRPDARNALDLTMRAELGDVVARVRDDDQVRAVVITGAGGAFCAGGDLKSLSEAKRPADRNRDRIRRLHYWFEQLVNLEKPVVAAVDEPAFGAGFNLALAADFILATPRPRFCAVFGRIGLVPDLGGFFLLPRIVGLQRAKEIVFTARVITPEEAKALGIVHEVHAPESLLADALAFAGRFRHASTAAVGIAKSVLNQSFHLDQKALSEMESYAQAVAMDTAYHEEAVARFIGKEPLAYDWAKLAGSNDGERS